MDRMESVLTLNAARPGPGEGVQAGEVRGGLGQHAGALSGHIKEGPWGQPQSLHTVKHAPLKSQQTQLQPFVLRPS